MFYKIILIIFAISVSNVSLAAPPIRFDRAKPNVFGGYTYYKDGRAVYVSHKNNTGSETIYSGKLGVEYRGFNANSPNYTPRWLAAPSAKK